MEDWLSSLDAWVGGVIMAIVMSVLRRISDGKVLSWWNITIEALLCGGLTLAAGSAIIAAGYGQGWYLFCGGFIGGMGSQSIRKMIFNRVNRK